jgi:hypothetical protein
MNRSILLVTLAQVLLFHPPHSFHLTTSTKLNPTTLLNTRPPTISKTYSHSAESTLPLNWETSLQKAIESAIQAPNHKRTEQ